jgi:tetratricopeptide (TPR) repeat protein
MAQGSGKLCSKCKTVNDFSANFCKNCGASLSDEKKDNKNSGESFLQRTNSFLIIGTAFIISLIIVFSILSSNREVLHNKLDKKQTRSEPKINPEIQQKLQELNLKIMDNPDDYQTNVQIANQYFDIQNYIEAIKHYRKAVQIQANDANVLIDLGVSFFNINQTDSALHYIRRALQINPDHLQGLYNAGVVHYTLGDLDSAIESWEFLIKKHANSAEARRAAEFIKQVKNQRDKS